MATREPSRSDGRRNRRSILEAASRVLMDDPHASIHDIAEAAGLTRATVYRHFPDRDALVRAIVQQAAAEVVPAMLEQMRPLPWDEAIDLLADQSMTLGAAYRDVILAAAHHPEDAARVAILGEPIETEIAARRAAGDVTNPMPDHWLAVCVRAITLAAMGELTRSPQVQQAVTEQLSRTLRDLLH